MSALDYLATKYHILHICISPYNSKAQGIVECTHYGLREALVHSCGKRMQDWLNRLNTCLWSQCITTCHSTGYSPYYMTFGVKPIFPFNLHEATFLAPSLGSSLLDTPTLIAIRAHQLEKRESDLEQMKQLVWRYCRKLAGYFEDANQNIIKTFDFQPGKLILICNSAEDSGLKNKYKPRYLGPFVVICHNQGGVYILAEMDGSISQQCFTTKRLIPFSLCMATMLPLSNTDLDTVNIPTHSNEILYLSAYCPIEAISLRSQTSLLAEPQASNIEDSNTLMCC